MPYQPTRLLFTSIARTATRNPLFLISSCSPTAAATVARGRLHHHHQHHVRRGFKSTAAARASQKQRLEELRQRCEELKRRFEDFVVYIVDTPEGQSDVRKVFLLGCLFHVEVWLYYYFYC
ncbi:hypothetical protein SAMD00023353_2900580 [Rosellinia necatrix]|uniref:Uncharacterized protein n=1 Tax=Rosellinia necatrix TaxID=77044 RepID=A0A1W2TJJ3_ROSNE|nr:hypothetical protein SAMD00023353_2900580 [Rosellinia necatrix]